VPTEDVTIRTLGKSAKPIVSVELLGGKEKLAWEQNADALVIRKPATWPCRQAVAFKIATAGD
jgi:alpha-L-fucosidase